MSKPSVFHEREINSYGKLWVADCSPEGGPVNPDQYFYFRTRKNAKRFAELVGSGMSAREATLEMIRKPE